MKLLVSLISAPDDPPLYTDEYQNQLEKLQKSLTDEGLEFEPSVRILMSKEGGMYFLGDFWINIIPTLGPLLGAIVGAWLHGRYGRKVRLKILETEIEAEAQTVEEVEKLLERAVEIQQRIKPKVIHEL
jgi:hypothetical protein